jgi:hypothetical protein
MTLVDGLINWAKTHSKDVANVVTFAGDDLFTRYEFFREDEWPDKWFDRKLQSDPTAKRPNALPWWLPVNAFLHHWRLGPNTPESFHDHPRWSITVCLKGKLIERTPWGDRHLKPGSVVFRSHRAIHAFEIPEDAGEVWTLFIVGRRKHRQNSYTIVPR